MRYCEICGKVSYLRKVKVDGAYLYACNRCIKKRDKKDRLKFKIRHVRDDYSEIIKMARVKLGLSQDELADKIGVNPTLIQLLELGKCKPDEAFAKKLESLLNIRLVKEEIYA
ncbi:MAG: helix-turn-helix domain-containing protein [Candidatus Nitrosothermus koennekii]|nr:MAG: helix-turn-helix domain-containing protein [Candidatus Nitrosothermus koennekii]